MDDRKNAEWPEWIIGVWNAVMYKRPVHPDEGITYPLRPRLLLRVWSQRGSLR